MDLRTGTAGFNITVAIGKMMKDKYGTDVRVLRRAYVTFDARYTWASGNLGPDWIDFDPIDLSGLRLSAGFNFILSEVR